MCGTGSPTRSGGLKGRWVWCSEKYFALYTSKTQRPLGPPDRVGDPVPHSHTVLCSRSITTVAVFLTFKKTIGQSSSPSPPIIAGKLSAEARDIVLECCLKENGIKFELHTAVVMPDHAHLLLSPLRNVDGWNFSLPQIMHAIKGASARRINMLTGPSWPSLAGRVLRSCLAIE